MNPHYCSVRVIYGDTDAMGIVYHTNYIRWFEMGRTEWLRSLDVVYADWEKQGVNLPLTQVYCHYHKPARYDDVVTVETTLDYLKRATIKFNYVIWDEQREQPFVEGYSIHACTNREGRVIRLPMPLIEAIATGLETTTNNLIKR